ncbi:MAG: hypothetical protein B6D72_01390 [gamma proteobacterium symbiont of Ctena orbiculata]|nr:MAG: hypothetical protein B6D72_01390 [gamma proteobacterium symbiont of Ctena orbiculata]
MVGERAVVSQLEGIISQDDITALSAGEKLSLEDEDRVAILQSTQTIDVQACPGSGKTTLIAAKLVLLANKWPYADRGVCVLSHTNVAKDEIIERLERSSTLEARRLLSYPHFIGTIQEFVNRYIALPFLRSNSLNEITVDNDEFSRVAFKVLERGQFAWLRATLNGLGSDEAKDTFLRQLFFYHSDSGLELNISSRPRAWAKSDNFERASRSLKQLKSVLDGYGIFLFRDMYTHAQTALSTNSAFRATLIKRFPIVFIDEMQDTQKFQDELLHLAFAFNSDGQIIQRFGDPDQAIFHGIDSEEPNESYNGKARDIIDYVIDRSFRFDDGLAQRIAPFSFNQIDLSTNLSAGDLDVRRGVHARGNAFLHSLFLFNDDTRSDVIRRFCELVATEFKGDYQSSDKFCVKVVGGVGNEIDSNDVSQLKIGHYWPAYDKKKAKRSFRPATLIEAIKYAHETKNAENADSYKLLIDGVLTLLKLAGSGEENGKPFTATSLRRHLEQVGKWQELRKLIEILLRPDLYLNEENWRNLTDVIKNLFGLNSPPEEATQWLRYHEIPEQAQNRADTTGDQSVLETLTDNMLSYNGVFYVGLSTIHGVKGETHDATLIVETKHHCFDIDAMIPFLLGELPSAEKPNRNLPPKPHHSRAFKPNQRFLRQFYVAMSRPRHLLCLALHESRIENEALVQKLRDNGWDVRRLAASRH